MSEPRLPYLQNEANKTPQADCVKRENKHVLPDLSYDYANDYPVAWLINTSLLITYYTPRTFYTLPHLIFPTALRGRYCYSRFTDKEMEAGQGG